MVGKLTTKLLSLLAIVILAAVTACVHRNKVSDIAANYANSGGVKLNKGDMDGALADFNKAIELKPEVSDH